MRLVNWLLFVVAAGFAAAPGSLQAADYRPAVCKAAKPYVGARLHDTPPATDLANAAGDLDAALPAIEAGRLDAAFDKALKATGARGMTAAVAAPGRGAWARRSGEEAALYYWASAGKQATAVVILQLVAEDRLTLADPVSKWVKGVPNGDAITVEHLLNHTSGLFSANEDLKVRKASAILSPKEELAVLRRHGALFCPGENWRYSNSGYSLLGRIIEQVDGRSVADAITARIITPLGLKEMRALGPNVSLEGVVLPVPSAAEPPTAITAPGPAGPIVASATDMIRFEQAVLAGPLLTPAMRALMLQRLYPMFGRDTFYGLGVMLYDVADTPSRLYWIGHSGGLPGARAVIVWAPEQKAFVAVALTGAGEAVPAANLLLKALAAKE